MNEQIEAIRNEIKRLQEIHERNLKKPMERGRIGYAHGVVACCDRILDFIDSLPEEKPSEDVEEAAEDYAVNTASYYYEDEDDEVHSNIDELKPAFLAGAQWQKEQDEKEQADLFTIVALDAAQRAKEQMMKEAVEGLFWNTPFPTICLDDCKDYNFKDNQRVRIIIVKEDAQ